MDITDWPIFGIAVEYLPAMVRGFWISIKLAAASTVLSVFLGLIAAVVRLKRVPVLAQIATFYVEVCRGTPLILQIFLVYFTLADWGLVLPAFWAGAIALGLFQGAFTSEIFRAGILSVPRGTIEAGLSIGLSEGQLYRDVILPQAVKLIVPPMTNRLILNLKETALTVTISVNELMFVAYNGAALTFRSTEFFMLAALFYLAVAYPASRFMRRFETKIEQPLGT